MSSGASLDRHVLRNALRVTSIDMNALIMGSLTHAFDAFECSTLVTCITWFLAGRPLQACKATHADFSASDRVAAEAIGLLAGVSELGSHIEDIGDPQSSNLRARRTTAQGLCPDSSSARAVELSSTPRGRMYEDPHFAGHRGGCRRCPCDMCSSWS